MTAPAPDRAPDPDPDPAADPDPDPAAAPVRAARFWEWGRLLP
ncbi:hypothetical protein [Streptomyces sp. NPDC057686]